MRRCRVVGRTENETKEKSINTFLEAANPLPLPFNSATTIGWQLDLCRLQSFFWQACVDTLEVCQIIGVEGHKTTNSILIIDNIFIFLTWLQ